MLSLTTQLDHQAIEVHGRSTVTQRAAPAPEKDEDREGEAERRRELAEEEMAQAGQPQKLEEDPDQLQEEEQEPEHEQADENALDQHRHQPQMVRSVLKRKDSIQAGLNQISKQPPFLTLHDYIFRILL